PPPAAPYAPPPPAYQQPPAPLPPLPQPQWSPQGAPIAVPAPPRPSAPAGPHSHDPSAFAATSPPPTTDEHEAQIRRSQAPVAHSPSAPVAHSPSVPVAHSPSAPPVAHAPPPAAAPGPGRDPELVEAGALRALAGFLVSYDQSELGVFWPLYQGQNVLGRKGASAGLDIEVDSPTTSSRHAIVYASARPGRLKVEDAGSTNGTFMNEAPLERGKKFELRDNDTLRFGGFSVTVKII
ncbi:MAG TPA: FHA domain-containing protein, partial [Polyangiaceae bacterium]